MRGRKEKCNHARELLIAIAVALACAKTGDGKPAATAVSKSAQPNEPKKVRVVVVESRAFDRVARLAGNVVPDRRAAITPLLPGQIAKIFVKPGDEVKRGEKLFRIVGTDYWMGSEHAVAQKGTSTAMVNQAKTAVLEAERAFVRFERLRKDKAIPEAEFEQAEARLKFARDQLRLAESQTRLADVGTRLARSKVGETIGYAPFDGRVVERLMEEGEIARTMPPSVIMAFVSMDPVHAEGALPETDLPAVRLGDTPIDIEIPAVREKAFRAKLTFISPVADAVTRTVKIKAQLPNGERTILPGMAATLTVHLSARQAVAVPREALLRLEHNTGQVFVVTSGTAHLREIEVGERSGATLAVRRGLVRGDRVIVAGHTALTEGAKVVE
ncbi:MAG: efflux RND transporter periplasmic adaptor subunit [Deltaproteobacteria bacterium]|nr:efflux RND transporter periplasmic adaptor subunit [Deltaproteobacteria bacterium]